jgi:hypothetical protein
MPDERICSDVKTPVVYIWSKRERERERAPQREADKITSIIILSIVRRK